MHRSQLLVSSLLLFGLAASGWADGDMRLASPAEREFTLSVLTVVSQAMPQPAPGYEGRDATRVEAPERVPAMERTEPMPVFYSVTWFNAEEAAKERAQEQEAYARAAAQVNDPAMQARQKAIAAKQKKLSAEFSKAVQKGNQGKIKKLQKEMEKLGQETAKLGQEQNAIVRKEARILSKLSRLILRVNVNDFQVSQEADKVKELEPIAGNPAFAFHDPEGKFEDRLIVLVGPWKKQDQKTRFSYQAIPASVAATQAQTIIVSAHGNPNLARQALAGVNWKALAGLIK